MNIPDEYKTGNPGMDAKIAKALAKHFPGMYVKAVPKAFEDLKPKTNKYSNTKTDVAGITFHSNKEAKRYGELKLREKAGEIANLQLQPRFTLLEDFYNARTQKKIRGIMYIGDFMYFDYKEECPVVEDVKGYKTHDYQIKRKLFMFKNPNILFREI